MKSKFGERGVTLLAPLRYWSDRYQLSLVVPNGFYSNFGSVPGFVPPWLAPRVGKLKEAYVLHDYIYATADTHDMWTRHMADMILYDAMKELKVWWWRRAIILGGVRVNIKAGHYWNSDEEDTNTGDYQD